MSKLQPASMLKHALESYRFKTDFYFDRLTIYFDAKTKKEDLLDIINDNPEKNKFKRVSLPHNDILDRKLNIFQPSDDCLKRLSAIGDYAITYVEFSLDFATKDKKAKKALVEFVDRHLVHIRRDRKRQEKFHYERFLGIRYLTPQKDKKRLAYYADKPSRKHSDMRCLHMDYRIAKWSLVKDMGIVTFADLVRFDHEGLWNALLDFRKPNYELLGEMSRGDGVSRQAQIKRGKKEWSNIDCLQEYLKCNTAKISAFDPLNDAQLVKWLRPSIDRK